MLHHICVWRSHCFMSLASRKYSIPLRNSLLSNISGSYLAAVSLHSHEARTGRVTRSRIQPPPPQSDMQPSSRKPMHSKVSQTAHAARQSISHTKQDSLMIFRIRARRLPGWLSRLRILVTVIMDPSFRILSNSNFAVALTPDEKCMPNRHIWKSAVK